ncbi:hypothetical protein [Nonomuraea candida]|uniref:hypothetical protein n=1 Tax=Nonomuraea candida TaxID=359159 RepID=UPI0005BB9140|nr:hypothetical protein [Nonomuraea candida]
MRLSRKERRALARLESRLARESPELDALLSGALGPDPDPLPGPLPGRLPRPVPEPLPVPADSRSLLHVWCMLVMLTCAVLMLGIVLLAAGDRNCTGLQSTSCQRPAGTQEG